MTLKVYHALTLNTPHQTAIGNQTSKISTPNVIQFKKNEFILASILNRDTLQVLFINPLIALSSLNQIMKFELRNK